MTLALLAGVIVGGLCGVFFGDSVAVVKPLGDIFLNFVFTLVVPIVFFSISSAICHLGGNGSVGRVFGVTLLVFIAMSLVAGVTTFFSTWIYSPAGTLDPSSVAGSMFDISTAERSDMSQAIVSTITVDDFWKIFSKAHLLPMIIFSAFLGFAVSKSGEKGKPFAAFLESGCEVSLKIMNIVMYAAPVGIGCFIANIIAQAGPQILGGYVRVFFMYIALSLIFFCIVNPLYILLFRGWKGVRLYWNNIFPPALIGFATTSSIAALPQNINAAKNMGASSEIAEAVLPLGVNVHKDGSMMSGVIKVIFLMALCGEPYMTIGAGATALVIAVLSSIVMGAVPNGGVTGELLTCTLMGFDPQMAGIIIIIGTIVDMPATMINTSTNTVSAVIIDSIVRRKK